MQSKKLFYWTLMLITTTLLLAGCGGGGGGGAAEPAKAFTVTITAGQNSLLSTSGAFDYGPGTDYASSLSIRVTESSGTPVVDGLVVSLSVSDAALGTLSADGIAQTASLSLVTVGGGVSAVFHSGGRVGSVQVFASAFDPAANRNVSDTETFNIAQGPDLHRLTLTATRDTIPADQYGVGPIFGGPFSSTIAIEYRQRNGELGSPEGGEVGVGIDPVTLGAFTTLDDPDTTDINELFVLLGNGSVGMAGGIGTVFVHSFDSPGLVTLSVRAQDSVTEEVFSRTIDVLIVEPASDGRPANIFIQQSETAQYVQGSGGRIANSIQFFLYDGAGEPVPDPPGYNNLYLEIHSESGSTEEFLSATDVHGNAVQGRSIAIATTAGVTSATLTSGTEPGIVRIRAVTDIIDGNVSNGIDHAIRAEISVVISDGVPFSITLSSILVNNPVASTVRISADPVNPDPNAIYSFRLSALVTDRFGNPPALPVQLQFGLIDSPLDGFPNQGPGWFSMSGLDGDPDEGGVGFFAPSAVFRTGGGGAGPGDTLILFGKDVTGNGDLESARTLDRVIDQTNLLVDQAFNLNDFTGRSVDNGPVVPYVIGRASIGNIETSVITDSDGVGETEMNYPATTIGRLLAAYVQTSNGGIGSNGDTRTLGDAALFRYPGLAPLSISAAPSIIQANTSAFVTICVIDGFRVPILGQVIGFFFIGTGNGSVDGIPGSGLVANATGSGGCTVALVRTFGVLDEATDITVTFSVNAGSCSDPTLCNAVVEIAAPANSILQAVPTVIVGDTTGTTINLTYLSSGGEPVSGIQLTGFCELDAGDGVIELESFPGVTDANGQTTATVSTAGIDSFFCGYPTGEQIPVPTPGVGTCTFTTGTGEPTVDVAVMGRAIDISGFSPSNCPALP